MIFCDIDGVLADNTHRLHYLKNKDYDKFYSDEEVMKDKPIANGLHLLEAFVDEWLYDPDVYLITGRNESCRAATEKWLIEKSSLIFEDVRVEDFVKTRLVMRKKHDFRPSAVVKVEQIRSVLDVNPLGPISAHSNCFIDDDPENVKAVEKAFFGITGLVFGTKRLEEK